MLTKLKLPHAVKIIQPLVNGILHFEEVFDVLSKTIAVDFPGYIYKRTKTNSSYNIEFRWILTHSVTNQT